MEEYEVDSCIRGYHVYQAFWEANIGDIFRCKRESHNARDRYVVAVVDDIDKTIGHVPHKISHICSLFLRRGGDIVCVVMGSRRYSHNLPQGGLKVPCKLIFSSNARISQNLRACSKTCSYIFVIVRVCHLIFIILIK